MRDTVAHIIKRVLGGFLREFMEQTENLFIPVEFASAPIQLLLVRNTENIMLSFLRIGPNCSQSGWIQLGMFVAFVKQCHMAQDCVSTWWAVLL